MRWLKIFSALFVLSLWAGQPALAVPASEWARNDQGALRLLSANETTGQGAAAPHSLRLGLHFDLKPGWKVYWRSPGDAGYPPSIDWTGSDNVASSEIRWPAPERFEILGLQSMGYEGEVVLPVDVRVERPGDPLRLRAKVDYLVCETLCIPHTEELALDLPSGPTMPSVFLHEIDRWAARVPGAPEAAGMELVEASAWGSGDEAHLSVTLAAEPGLSTPDLFVEGPGYMQFGPPRVTLEQGGRRAVLTAAVLPGSHEGRLDGQTLTLTVVDGNRGMEVQATPRAAAPPGTDWAALGGILGLALLGGLILNLMPCVLPVLSLKVLSVIGHGGAERRQIRAGFVASAAGILVSFLVLAAAAVAVKAAGMAVGWGIQFQQPLFLIALVVVVSLFAANLWGLFEVPLPSWLGGLGGSRGNPHSLAGHFATGAFATILATPCTAPFLGTAVGFALSRGSLEIMAVFAALGLGMALPYLAVAAFPGLAQRLPRPGRWMITLRRILGVALAGTALWLLSVLAVQVGMAGAALVAGMMVLALLILGLRRRLPRPARPAAGLAVAGLSLMTFVMPFQAISTTGEERLPSGHWQGFDQAAITRLVGEGGVVFVDVTADWCITCQVNKRVVLDRGDVAQRLAGDEVTAMRADWTRPSDEIAAYLAGFGRYGIPFNVVYGPGAPEGIVLPELLTEAQVLDALERAGTGN
ncbi:protein-disulfide reductase DsbD [Telmatospirillum sp. J64-1]|uniref:protein-disulfide reductase DsbD family protein n=1 Tax=Telmatospirillum sp. J64-1 TaxID=2502183 RepID=UPI00115EAC0E|nr:protein-disulfide reductase DsbD domain-containing protein [Telmatospirillum sp. J64-1]